mgnify:FL=1
MVSDYSGRKIRFPAERWKHIIAEHPDVSEPEEIKETLLNPLKITPSKYSPENVCYYYRYLKPRKRYLLVAVKYLNGEGFVITAYYRRTIA